MGDLLEQFGARLAAARERAGLSQGQLQDRLRVGRGSKSKGKSHSQISAWEKGANAPGIDTVQLMADAVGADPRELAFGSFLGPALAEKVRRAATLSRELADLNAEIQRALIVPPKTDDTTQEPQAGPHEAPAAATTGDEPVPTATKSKIILRPADADDEGLPDVRFEPRTFTADQLRPLKRGKLAEIAGLAAGSAKYFELVEVGDYHENGVRYLIAKVSGRSMETKIPNRSKVVLEVFSRPLELRSGDQPEDSGIRDGHVYMVGLEDGLVTLKRLYLTDGASVLGAYNTREFGKRGVQTIPPGEPFRVLAKWEGFYEG